jgi:hypothetical protein
MANPTTNYGFVLPTPTDLVTDLPADFDVALQGVDTRLKALQPGTTLGDIAYSSATANTNTRLALGTAGQVLQVNSGATAPEWATSSSGGMTSIASGSLSGASVVLSSIPSTYNNLMLVVRNYLPATNDSNLFIRYNNDSGAKYRNLSYNTAPTNNYTFPSTEIQTSGQSSSSSNSLVIVNFWDYKNTTTWKMANVIAAINNSSTPTNLDVNYINSTFADNSAITSIGLIPQSGNFTSGTYILYGVK